LGITGRGRQKGERITFLSVFLTFSGFKKFNKKGQEIMTTQESIRKFGFSTRQLHAGQQPDPTTNSMAVPIYQTASYVFNSTEQAANLFALKEPGNIYSRMMNPTNDVFEQRIADLEGGVGALATSSGHAAQAQTILALTAAGDHIVAASTLYGGTYNQFAYTFPRLGIDVTLVDPRDPENFRKAIRPNTKILYGESLGNPLINVFPIEEVAAIGREFGIPLVVDNTLLHPTCCGRSSTAPISWSNPLLNLSAVMGLPLAV
jgi:O-acetylhomoserine (thiol)-lyase